jgi:zinc transport system ATP-binding protein
MNAKQDILAEVKGIQVSIQGRRILDNVDLAVHSGEILALIGPNGAGKTTLVRAILGLLRPDAGEVRLHPGMRIGYMPQRLNVDTVLPLTVRRFLSLASRCSEQALRHALSEVGVGHLLESPVQGISGGEMQRVMLARALLRKPDLLILDEPVQGVDVNGQVELFELIGEIRDRHGCGILMVSHDLHLVMAKTDRVFCLNQHVCCSGHPAAVSSDPAYLELFGAQPALAIYTHHHDHHHDLSGQVVEEAEGHDHG